MQIQLQKVLTPNILQCEALEKLEETEQKKGVVVMPTGTGKTYLAALWTKKQLENDSDENVLFVCHNNDILSQANEKEFKKCLKEFRIKHGYYNAKEKNIQQATFGTVQTLSRNLKKINPEFFDYIIVDECHHYQAKSFKKVLQYFKPKFMLGLTATPNRMDGLDIQKVLGKKLYQSTIRDAIKKGLLVKINYQCADTNLDFSDVKYTGKGYCKKSFNKTFCVPEYDDAILREYEETIKSEYGKNKTICFCATVEHVHRMAKLFNDNGIKAVGLTGRNRLNNDLMFRDYRKTVISDFKEGKYDIIFVRDLFNEGIDVPNADSIMMLRPTQSHTIFTQQIGRGLRNFEGKDDVLIIDFTGNSKKCNINFEVMSDIIGKDIIKTVKKSCEKRKETKDITIISNGCKVTINKTKINILTQRVGIKKEKLIEEYFRVKKELGYAPTANDFRMISGIDSRALNKFYGSWNLFIKEQGEPLFGKIKGDLLPTKEELIDNYYNLIKNKPYFKSKGGNGFTKLNGSKYSIHRYKKVFGSWNNFLKEVGEQTNHIPFEKVDKNDLLDNFKKLKKIKGSKLCVLDLVKMKSKYSYGCYVYVFGSWDNILKEVGDEKISKEKINRKYKELKEKLGDKPTKKEFLAYSNIARWSLDNKLTIKERKNMFRRIYRKEVSESELINEYKKVEQLLGRSPSWTELNKIGKWSASTYDNRYGSVANFEKSIKSIGFRSKSHYILEYNKIKYKIGKIPTIGDMRENKPSEGPYRRLWGSWNNFLKEVGDYKKERLTQPKQTNESIKTEKCNVVIVRDYKCKNKVESAVVKMGGVSKGYKGMVKKVYLSRDDKCEIRSQIVSHVSDGDVVLMLDGADLSAIKEIESQNKLPSKIVIPNNKEFNKVADALENYDTNLNIELVNTSALQYLSDSIENFDFVWLDYCGAFSYYTKDLDVLFQKQLNNIKLVLTYNLFDPAKDDDSYYYNRVVDYVAKSISGKRKFRMIKDITYRYKRNMYNIGFNINGVGGIVNG